MIKNYTSRIPAIAEAEQNNIPGEVDINFHAIFLEKLGNEKNLEHLQQGYRNLLTASQTLLAHARQLREELSQLTRPIPKELVGNIEQLIGRAEVYLKEGSPSSEFKGLSAVMADWMELGKIFKELIPCVKLLVAQTLQLHHYTDIVCEAVNASEKGDLEQRYMKAQVDRDSLQRMISGAVKGVVASCERQDDPFHHYRLRVTADGEFRGRILILSAEVKKEQE